MFHRRRLKVFLLVFCLIGSSSLAGCVPLVFLAANPIITAAIIAAVPAVITVWSNHRSNQQQNEIRRLEAETARTKAISDAASTLNQQVVAQRQLELQLIDKETQTSDPAVKQQLAELQSKVAQDQQVIAQSLNTANQEATSLANDKSTLPGMSGGSTRPAPGGNTPGVTPLTPPNPADPAAPATAPLPAPPAGTPPLTTDPAVTAGSTAPGTRLTSPAPAAPALDVTNGAVASTAVANTPPPVLGVAGR